MGENESRVNRYIVTKKTWTGGIGEAHPTVPSDMQESKSSLLLLSCYIAREPGGIQTHDLQNRNLMLYSAKLRVRLPREDR